MSTPATRLNAWRRSWTLRARSSSPLTTVIIAGVELTGSAIFDVVTSIVGSMLEVSAASAKLDDSEQAKATAAASGC
jgi:hypothetical protein